MGSDVHLGYKTLHNNHWENSAINTEFKLEARPLDTIKYSSQHSYPLIDKFIGSNLRPKFSVVSWHYV